MCGFALPPNRGPVQRRAPFLVLPQRVAVAEQQQLDGVREPLVRGPVQGRPPVEIHQVQISVPPCFEVVKHPGVAVLRGDVRGVVPSHVRGFAFRAVPQQKLGARQRPAHARPVQRGLLVPVPE